MDPQGFGDCGLDYELPFSLWEGAQMDMSDHEVLDATSLPPSPGNDEYSGHQPMDSLTASPVPSPAPCVMKSSAQQHVGSLPSVSKVADKVSGHLTAALAADSVLRFPKDPQCPLLDLDFGGDDGVFGCQLFDSSLLPHWPLNGDRADSDQHDSLSPSATTTETTSEVEDEMCALKEVGFGDEPFFFSSPDVHQLHQLQDNSFARELELGQPQQHATGENTTPALPQATRPTVVRIAEKDRLTACKLQNLRQQAELTRQRLAAEKPDLAPELAKLRLPTGVQKHSQRLLIPDRPKIKKKIGRPRKDAPKPRRPDQPYTREEMKAVIARYHQKRPLRVFDKGAVRYKSRSDFASKRCRIGGRFVKRSIDVALQAMDKDGQLDHQPPAAKKRKSCR